MDNEFERFKVLGMRHGRILGSGPLCFYHVLSRVIERRFIFDVPGREYLRQVMRSQEAFCGVRVLTWACLSNHFHILVAVPDRESELAQAEMDRMMQDDDAFLVRLKHIYTGEALDDVHARLQEIRQSSGREEVRLRQIAELKRPFFDRMYDLSAFVGELKQRVSQWYNGTNDRKGPLWEDRFKSVLVQGEPGVLATVAAYIDLNAVRAGIVKDPREWRWCGYSEAAAVQGRARSGMFEVLGESGRSLNDSGTWRKVHQCYRSILFAEGRWCSDEDGRVVRRGFTQHEIDAEEVRDFEIPSASVLHRRVRYFCDGAALGITSFVDAVFDQNKTKMGVKRSVGARNPKKLPELGALRTLRDLRGEI